MDYNFTYNTYVTGKNNIGRAVETKVFSNLLLQGENIVIYEPPKTGKMSLIQQAFFNLKSSGQKFTPIYLSLFNIRSVKDFILSLANALIHTCGNTPSEYENAIAELLPQTNFIFDRQQFELNSRVVSLSWDLNRSDIRAVLSLPYRLAESKGECYFVILDEFQNIMLSEGGEDVCKILESVFRRLSLEDRTRAAYILCGSSYNAMREIFDVQKLFYHQIERVKLNTINPKLIVDYINKGLLESGKVIDKELLLSLCDILRSNMWYLNHFVSICESMTRGYITELTFHTAVAALVSIHEPRFKAIMNDLTTFQVNMLRAVLCGHTKFTSVEVIEEFGLNSSANVKRLKDALSKKEIVDFSGEKPLILDPLFEYWARKTYFALL